ncbi:uncharacterized protein AMSG_08103 [Thecamonas trahens ATCC 50062]|uniref:Uncharacterized protein n=1 Tax=Thecamonas trahens ATCC 50062 TaxID=461836 RepID=A0A0L0DKG1_THETB|nr:hypothetical protein AMSG_08103 [Thecamonas trahens ATCC 50062]KNC52536.1 hypothetical protein AMSG_08103 [Thecamonas trahens ATCC 50062]|eukprot:XP_013755327.1 hypothetical protein AMSG_08103 [Thecamonas trahens ATCC 50062]
MDGEPLLRAGAGGDDRGGDGDAVVIKYTFTGKLTLFPLFVILMFAATGLLLTRGTRPYNAGYFTSSEVYYGLAGLAMFITSLWCVLAIALWVVFRVTVAITHESMTVTKSGVFRSASLSFDRNDLSLHYFRTHYLESSAWLKLVVREGERYYVLLSWKGAGDQKARFMEFFNSLQRVLATDGGPLPAHDGRDVELISRDEMTFITPFAARLRALQASHAALRGGSSMLTSAANTTCLEDLSFFNGDRFTRHFVVNKATGEPLLG